MGLFDRFKKKKEETPKPKTVSVTWENGTVEEYPENFIITDKENCCVCMDGYYHTSLDCEHLKWEHTHSGLGFRAMTIKEAKKQKRTYCQDCSRELYLYEHDRLEDEW